MNTIDTTNLCSHLQKKLFEEEGVYHRLWLALQDDPELTAVVRSRQLHIYRNGKKVLVLAGKIAPKVIREDRICEMVPDKHIFIMSAVLSPSNASEWMFRYPNLYHQQANENRLNHVFMGFKHWDAL